MKRRTAWIGLVVAAAGLAVGVSLRAGDKAESKRKLLRIGVYDSRTVTVAFAPSEYNENVMVQKSKEKKQAEAEGDKDKAGKIDQWMTYYSIKLHGQGFATLPVHDLLECVKDKLPEVAEAAGVDAIVSKWEFDYLAADVEVVDVTEQLIRLYYPEAPSEKTMRSIRQIMKVKPMSLEDIVLHELEGGH
ncbi:MAG: hypothetical protein JXA82_17450 [Sedimentisphaerales bacterium]|nr:hypothetical protein [Sedimentisphaerales bacterium]